MAALCSCCVLCSKSGRVMFFKVPFAAVPDLVARRQVLLRDGYAYVREAQVCHGRGSVLHPVRQVHTHKQAHHELTQGVASHRRGAAAAGPLCQACMRVQAACLTLRLAVCVCVIQVGSLVVGCFRMHLSAALTETAWAWGNFTATEADRLAPLVDNLPNR